VVPCPETTALLVVALAALAGLPVYFFLRKLKLEGAS
jgi:asparagine N-glycosylation enzyme membrane subunit Stt3